MLAVSAKWRNAYPGAFLGVLAMRAAANPEVSPQLEALKKALEADLRAGFASFGRAQLKSHPVLASYIAYYKAFDKTYHVQHQLESVVFKGKAIPSGAALVEAMFMAELKNLLLTAGHDLDSVRGDVAVDVATGNETYLTLSEQERTLKPDDMFIHDEVGILSSVIYGPDRRTRVTPATTRVLFTVYAPPGISAAKVGDHLTDLREFVQAVSSTAEVEHSAIVGAGP
jgi:DNA/RNA-binding domain of Phe-tRNA-synthetase-like protein